MNDPLLNGQLDAVVQVEPFRSALMATDKTEILSWTYVETAPNSDITQYIALAPWVEKNRATAEKFARAVIKGAEFANGNEAGPADELKYIEQIRHQYYADLLTLPAPVSEANFRNYGASTTPTLVLIDRHGIVRLYHPGAMTLDELRAALNRVG